MMAFFRQRRQGLVAALFSLAALTGCGSDEVQLGGPHRDAAADGSSDAAPVLSGEVRDVVFVGSTTHVRVAVGARELQVVVTNDGGMWVPSPGTAVGVVVPFDAVRVLAS